MNEYNLGPATMILDPTGHYGNPTKAAQACGLLWAWAADSIASEAKSIGDYVASAYQFFMGWDGSSEAYIEDDLFMFPGDPPLYPLVKIERGDEVLLVYPHAIVVNIQGEKMRWTRMD